MIDSILQTDYFLFTVINRLPHNFFLDTFFSIISGLGTYGAIWIVIVFFLFIWEEVKDRQGFYALILSIIITYLTVETGIKNIIRRPRPFLQIPQMIEVGNISSTFSFFSGHVTIAFAAAYILSYNHRKGKRIYYFLALLIAFSRIYLGKHYPSDVLIGMIIGFLIGCFCVNAINLLSIKNK